MLALPSPGVAAPTTGACGAVTADTTIVRVAAVVLARPRESVTVRVALKLPGAEYVCENAAVPWVTGALPSPKFSVKLATVSPASGSLEPEASNATCSGARPESGVAESAAIGAAFAPVTAIDSGADGRLRRPRPSRMRTVGANVPLSS